MAENPVVKDRNLGYYRRKREKGERFWAMSLSSEAGLGLYSEKMPLATKCETKKMSLATTWDHKGLSLSPQILFFLCSSFLSLFPSLILYIPCPRLLPNTHFSSKIIWDVLLAVLINWLKYEKMGVGGNLTPRAWLLSAQVKMLNLISKIPKIIQISTSNILIS